MRAGGRQLWAVDFNFGGFTTVLGILPTRYSCSPTAHKMDTSTGGPSQQPGPTPAALVLARSGGMPRVGALRLAASSAPTRPVPQLAIAARQEEEQSRLAIGPGNRIRPVGVADSSNTRVEVAAPLGAVPQHRTLVAGDGASTAAGILAVPDAGPAAFAAASLQLRAQRGQTPSAAEWRTMPQLRAEWWLCRHCKDAVNHNSATHYLQHMCVERQGDDAICKSSRGRGPLNQRTAHRVWSETEECAGKRAACRSGCCADAGQRRLCQRCPCPDCELSAWVEAAGGDGGVSCLPF